MNGCCQRLFGFPSYLFGEIEVEWVWKGPKKLIVWVKSIVYNRSSGNKVCRSLCDGTLPSLIPRQYGYNVYSFNSELLRCTGLSHSVLFTLNRGSDLSPKYLGFKREETWCHKSNSTEWKRFKSMHSLKVFCRVMIRYGPGECFRNSEGECVDLWKLSESQWVLSP